MDFVIRSLIYVLYLSTNCLSPAQAEQLTSRNQQHFRSQQITKLLQEIRHDGFLGQQYLLQSSRPKPKKDDRPNRETFVIEEEICPVDEGWVNITRALTTDKVAVEIYQEPGGVKQWFYSVSCKQQYNGKRCRLISEEYETRCQTRNNYIPALVKPLNAPESTQPTWQIIAIPGQCICVQQRQRSSVHRSSAADFSAIDD